MSLSRNRSAWIRSAWIHGAWIRCVWAACAGLAASFGAAPRAVAGDLIITGAKPDRLFVIDATTRTVRAEHRIPGADGLVSVIVISPDQRTAYVLVDRLERVVGIDLATGREVFRADLSTPEERIKCFMSLALTPDGKELVVYELPTKLLSSEYVVQEPRFAVYRTNAGLAANRKGALQIMPTAAMSRTKLKGRFG